jgi:anti-sigma-K factor RskA
LRVQAEREAERVIAAEADAAIREMMEGAQEKVAPEPMEVEPPAANPPGVIDVDMATDVDQEVADATASDNAQKDALAPPH